MGLSYDSLPNERPYEFADTRDLINELEHRFDHFVCIMARDSLNDKLRSRERFFRGDLLICLGLLVDMQGSLVKELDDITEPMNEDGET